MTTRRERKIYPEIYIVLEELEKDLLSNFRNHSAHMIQENIKLLIDNIDLIPTYRLMKKLKGINVSYSAKIFTLNLTPPAVKKIIVSFSKDFMSKSESRLIQLKNIEHIEKSTTSTLIASMATVVLAIIALFTVIKSDRIQQA